MKKRTQTFIVMFDSANSGYLQLAQMLEEEARCGHLSNILILNAGFIAPSWFKKSPQGEKITINRTRMAKKKATKKTAKRGRPATKKRGRGRPRNS